MDDTWSSGTLLHQVTGHYGDLGATATRLRPRLLSYATVFYILRLRRDFLQADQRRGKVSFW